MARPKGSKSIEIITTADDAPEHKAIVEGVLKRNTPLQRQIADEYDLMLIPDDHPTAFIFRSLNGNSVCLNMVNYGTKEAVVNTLRAYGVIG